MYRHDRSRSRPLGSGANAHRTAARAALARGRRDAPHLPVLNTDAALICPSSAWDLRDGLPFAELSSTGTATVVVALAKLWGDVPTPSRSVVSMLSSRLGLRSFWGAGVGLCGVALPCPLRLRRHTVPLSFQKPNRLLET